MHNLCQLVITYIMVLHPDYTDLEISNVFLFLKQTLPQCLIHGRVNQQINMQKSDLY